KTVALQLVGHLTGVIDRFLQRRVGIGIFGVADHQRITVARGGRGDGPGDRDNQREQQGEASLHHSGGERKRRRLQHAPRRHYSTQPPLSNRGRTASTACSVVIIAAVARKLISFFWGRRAARKCACGPGGRASSHRPRDPANVIKASMPKRILRHRSDMADRLDLWERAGLDAPSNKQEREQKWETPTKSTRSATPPWRARHK